MEENYLDRLSVQLLYPGLLMGADASVLIAGWLACLIRGPILVVGGRLIREFGGEFSRVRAIQNLRVWLDHPRGLQRPGVGLASHRC